MKARQLIMLAAVAGLAAMITLFGCKKKEEPAAPTQAPATEKMEEMHKHAEEMKETATKAAEEANKTVTEAAAEIEQTICPVMEGPINKDIYTEYKGKKVYFCCAACKTEFEKDPEKYVAKLPQFKQ